MPKKKNNYGRSRRTKQIKEESISWFWLVPLLFAIGVVPLIVFMNVHELEGIATLYWTDATSNVDFFSYTKMVWIIVSSAVALIYFMICIRFEYLKEKKDIFYIPLAVYALFVFLSTLLAQYRDIAVFGFPDRYEGMLVLFAYIAFTVIAFHMVDSKKNAWILFGALAISSLIVGTIGIFQFYGMDFFRTHIGKLTILPSEHHDMADGLNFRFGAKTIYTTMYNTNNVGSYMAMVFPITLAMSFFANKKWVRIILASLSVLLFFNAVGSNSRAGYIGGLTAILVLFIVLRKKIFPNFLKVGVIVASFVIIFVSLSNYADARIVSRVQDTAKELFGVLGIVDVVEEEEVEEEEVGEEEEVLDVVDVFEPEYKSENELLVKIDDVPLTLRVIGDGSQVLFIDEDDEALVLGNVPENDGLMRLESDVYEGIYVKSDRGRMELIKGDHSLRFLPLNNTIYPIDDDFNMLMAPETPPVDDYYLDEGILYIHSGDSKLVTFRQHDNIVFFDENDNFISVQPFGSSNRFVLNDKRFKDYLFVLNRHSFRFYKNGELVDRYKIGAEFVLEENEEYKGQEGEEEYEVVPEFHFEPFDFKTWGFEGMESAGSSRGYIYSRSIPMMLDTMLIGHGPDTYAIYFPQHDYEGKREFLSTENRLVDKPHSMYLQMGINTGVPSLLAFIAMIIIYFISCFKIYRRIDYSDEYYGFSIGILCGVVGYLITGFFNDSIVSVAPVFWILLGAGFSINRIIKLKQEKVKEA